MHLDKIQDKIIDEFDDIIDQVKGRFRYLRHLARLGAIQPAARFIEKTNTKLIRLTKWNVWLGAEYKDGRVYYFGDSDSRVLSGILQLYLRVFSGSTPAEIMNSNLYFTNEIALYNNLPPERQNEISALLQQIKSLAVGFRAKSLQSH